MTSAPLFTSQSLATSTWLAAAVGQMVATTASGLDRQKERASAAAKFPEPSGTAADMGMARCEWRWAGESVEAVKENVGCTRKRSSQQAGTRSGKKILS